MKSIDRLVTEHDLIERGLAVLEKAVGRIESGGAPPSEFAAWAPDFFAQFADHRHHAKEEDLFFPVLKERGIPEEGGPIGVMLHEHVLGRDCVQRMREAAAADSLDAASFAAAARQFIPLLRQHIFKENNVLFKMAEQVLTEEDDARLDAQFTQTEQDQDQAAMLGRYEAEIARWEEQLA